MGQAFRPKSPGYRKRFSDRLGRRQRSCDRADPGSGHHGGTDRRADDARRHSSRGCRERSRQDRGDRAPPRDGPHRTRVRARLRPAAGRARLHRCARCAQHRRGGHARRGHRLRGPAPGRARRRDRRRRRRRGRGRAAASGRGPARGCAPHRRDRAEPRLQRCGTCTRLVGCNAVPHAFFPRLVGDPEPEDHRSGARRCRSLRARSAQSVSTLLVNAHVVTMDDEGTEHPGGWILLDEGFVQSFGTGERPDADEVQDLGGAGVTPGLVNTHHHLWQNLTRARAQEENLFGWLKALYPVWAALDEEAEYAAARAGLAELALSGCTTVFDHHYLFPPGAGGLLEAEILAARELGVRIFASRGSMDLGESDGGLPPDAVVERRDDVLAATELAAGLADGADVEIAVAPCSPFSVTSELMRESAELARRLGLRLHTHLAETVEEEDYCRELYGCTPVEYLEELGWLAEDVWCAHCVHLSGADVAKFGARDVGVAHCPSSNMRLGAGIAPVRELLDAGVRVGLGVDGSASNERGDLFHEVKQALLVARARGGPEALTARDALRLGTRGGAAVLGRDDIGELSPGKRADLAVWRTDGLELGGAGDLVAGLVFSGPHRVDRLYVGGEPVVRDGHLIRADEVEIASEHRRQAERFAA